MADVHRLWADRIRAERKARGWDKAQMARQLARAAGPARNSLPSHESLLSYVKRWERGTGISERYRLLYAAAFDIPEEELFHDVRPIHRPFPVPGIALDDLITPDEQERLTLAAKRPARVDAAAAESLSTILAAQRRTEDTIGSAPMIEPATGHLRLILRLLTEARGPLANRLAAIASDASHFVGWLFTATGAHDSAGPMYDQALRLGLQAGDNDLAGAALSMRGHLAWVTEDLTAMAGLSRAAADLATSPAARAVAVQQDARALALLGDRQGALRAIGRAEDTLTADGDGPDLLYFYGPELLRIQRGLILACLAESPADHAAAADLITSGIEALPQVISDSEWMAWYRVQAARAWAAAGEVGESVAKLRGALDIVSATGGAKTRTEIAEVQQSMAEGWPDDSDVAELGEALR